MKISIKWRDTAGNLRQLEEKDILCVYQIAIADIPKDDFEKMSKDSQLLVLFSE